MRKGKGILTAEAVQNIGVPWRQRRVVLIQLFLVGQTRDLYAVPHPHEAAPTNEDLRTVWSYLADCIDGASARYGWAKIPSCDGGIYLLHSGRVHRVGSF
jgi:hypothetical protein